MQENNPAIHPTVKIGNTEEIAGYMMRHQLDVGIIEGNFKKKHRMHVEDFAEDYMVVVASPNHPIVMKGKPFKIAELEQEKWVLREIGSGTREAADTIFEHHKMTPNLTM